MRTTLSIIAIVAGLAGFAIIWYYSNGWVAFGAWLIVLSNNADQAKRNLNDRNGQMDRDLDSILGRSPISK